MTLNLLVQELKQTTANMIRSDIMDATKLAWELLPAFNYKMKLFILLNILLIITLNLMPGI